MFNLLHIDDAVVPEFVLKCQMDAHAEIEGTPGIYYIT